MEYITKQTKYDLYFISVKNRLKDYYAAANTIPYMQPELQASANLILKRLEDFINNRLFDTVKKFMDKDIIENGNSSNCSIKESNGHKCLITKYFVMMDHSMFEYAENNIRNYYTDVSLMSSIPTEQVMPALKKASEEFDKLAKCESTNDFEDIIYYKNATKALKAAARGDITLTGYDARQKAVKVVITPKTEAQAKDIMSFFESNWEGKADGYNGNICYFDGWAGIPQLEVELRFINQGIDGENGYVPYYIAVRPTPDYDAYGGKLRYEDVSIDIFRAFNTEHMKQMIKDAATSAKTNRNNIERNDI